RCFSHGSILSPDHVRLKSSFNMQRQVGECFAPATECIAQQPYLSRLPFPEFGLVRREDSLEGCRIRATQQTGPGCGQLVLDRAEVFAREAQVTEVSVHESSPFSLCMGTPRG